MATTDLEKIIDNANIDDLRDLIKEGIESIPEFKKLAEKSLCPPLEEVNFTKKLNDAIDRETKEFSSRYDTREVIDWSNVYYDFIKPWCENADTLSNEKLYDLIETIIKKVAMKVTEEDFYGDDWYGDDFSGDIESIMNALCKLIGILLVSEDTTEATLKSLKKLIQTAQKQDVIDDYIGAPYETLLDLIDVRIKEGKVTSDVYEAIIGRDLGEVAGEWICREIDFLRVNGQSEQARKIMDEDADYPEVSLKHYGELMEAADWKGAISILDKAQDMVDKGIMRYSAGSPNWLELKQSILLEHGSIEERIDNLQALFLSSLDKAKYYRQLKELVKPEEWKDFYHNLLNKLNGYNALDEVAPFLIEEGEYDWLYRLVSQTEQKDDTDYRTPLKYAGALRSTHSKQMEAQLTRTITAYAADRYAPKKKVNSSKYDYFREDLASLADKGYPQLRKELTEFLLKEYAFRPSLTKQLRSIKL